MIALLDIARQLLADLLRQSILQNTLEQSVLALSVHVIWAAAMPWTWQAAIPAAAILFFLGRMLFWRGYSHGAPARALGFALTFYPTTGVDDGIWITQSWLSALKLAAGRTTDALADGLPLLARLQGTRNETALAICRRTVVAALLAQDDLERARPLAKVGWRQAARFALLAHAAWPDLLALMAALEDRPRAAATRVGVGDAGWARTGRQRGATTRAAIQRAERSIVRSARLTPS